MRWIAVEPDDLLWVHFDDGAAVYHRPSGRTHFLNAASVVLLQGLSEAPAATAEAASWLASGVAPQSGPPLLERVEKILGRYENLGLVRRLAS